MTYRSRPYGHLRLLPGRYGSKTTCDDTRRCTCHSPELYPPRHCVQQLLSMLVTSPLHHLPSTTSCLYRPAWSFVLPHTPPWPRGSRYLHIPDARPTFTKTYRPSIATMLYIWTPTSLPLQYVLIPASHHCPGHTSHVHTALSLHPPLSPRPPSSQVFRPTPSPPPHPLRILLLLRCTYSFRSMFWGIVPCSTRCICSRLYRARIHMHWFLGPAVHVLRDFR